MKNEDLVAAIEVDFESAGELSDKNKVMLRYAVKLTVSPAEMQRSDIHLLRTAGFTEIDILHIAEVVAYYAYVNRIADGLGVDLEG